MRLLLTVLIVLGLLGGFLILFGIGLVETWTAKSKPPNFSDGYLYVATAVAGFVSGVVAVGLGQKPPAAGGGRVARLGRIASGSSSSAFQTWIGGLYGLAYVVYGFAALITWPTNSDVTPDLIKNLAVIALGLFIAVGTSFLRPDSP
jgi:hypothetical protein